MPDVYVTGVGMTAFGRREEPLERLIYDAAEHAIEDAERADDGIDVIYVGTMAPEVFVGISNVSTLVADTCGLVGTPATRVGDGPSAGSMAFMQGYLAIRSGLYDNVLVVAGEKMTSTTTAVSSKILGGMLADCERIYGLTAPALAALLARRYMHEYGLSRETLALVAVKNHANGYLNPYAHFRKRVTLDKVLSGKMVAEPLTIYDCSPMSDGAAAVLLSNRRDAVRVSGIGQGTDFLAAQHRASLTSLNATRLAAERAYQMAHITEPLTQIDVAELHDAFTILEIIDSEDVGFFKPGEGGKALAEGSTGIEGKLPINPSGGLKARGHPVGATGLAQVCEIAWQLRGQAGQRQVDGARTGLTQNIGGFGNNILVTVMEACA